MCVALCVVYATSKPTEKKDRVHHEKPLSSHEHNDDEGYEYDHEAFLGQEEAKTFDDLAPEESLRRLGIIVDKIDGDQDGFVTEAELKAWIKKSQKRYIYDSVDRQWKDFDTNNDGLITWEEYRNVTYGPYLEDPSPSDDGYDYQKMMARDERRFKMADRNGDHIADKEEFTAFLHPDDYDHMKDIVVLETMEDIDKMATGSSTWRSTSVTCTTTRTRWRSQTGLRLRNNSSMSSETRTMMGRWTERKPWTGFYRQITTTLRPRPNTWSLSLTPTRTAN